ncbi:MAG: signal recognition particle-docking protein FtsY [Alphaproteobacteria bacterium]|nr:signal recognition particle-docking protein FtsY [Alphaproteobacteria bacterium]
MTDTEEGKKTGFFQRLRQGLSRSATGVTGFFRKRKLDQETLDELEERLIAADLGPRATARALEGVRERWFDKEVGEDELKEALAKSLQELLELSWRPLRIDPDKKPHVFLVIGVNGSGKTTTIGKIAKSLRAQGKTVMLAAADTFRAAAIEQLQVWGERNGVPVIGKAAGSDAAGVAFEALERAQAAGTDVLIIDTAGRLQNKANLMAELEKIIRVMKKRDPSAPHHTLLVLDATTGHNAVSQVETFREIAGVSGLVMTKLDGTARGGILVALADRCGLPIYWIGVGEAIDDLQIFHPRAFSRALVGLEKE